MIFSFIHKKRSQFLVIFPFYHQCSFHFFFCEKNGIIVNLFEIQQKQQEFSYCFNKIVLIIL